MPYMSEKISRWKVYFLRMILFVFIVVAFAALPKYLEKIQIFLHDGKPVIATRVDELLCKKLDDEQFCVYEVFYQDGAEKSALTKYLTSRELYNVGDTLHVDGLYVLESYWDITPYNYRVYGLGFIGSMLFLFIDRRFLKLEVWPIN